MRILSYVLFTYALLGLVLRLTTFEFQWIDDPTNGIALRIPFNGLTPLVRLEDQKPQNVLLQDENRFIGRDIYRFTVTWGWGLASLGIIGGLVVLRRNRKPSSSKA